MQYKGSEAYDQEAFFRQYIAKRSRKHSPNDLLEEPIITALLGEVKDKIILDLGCGDGLYGKKLLEKGAKYYQGIDNSENMLKLAQENLTGCNHQLEKIAIEEVNLTQSNYDIVLSRLVFHYIEDVAPVFEKIYACLTQAGQFVFSIEHPIITSCYEAYHSKAKTKRENWIVDHYFSSGQRINHWIGKEVIKYHRTIEEYFALIKNSGLNIVNIRESKPNKEDFENQAEYERRMRIPLFMIFKVVKNSE